MTRDGAAVLLRRHASRKHVLAEGHGQNRNLMHVLVQRRQEQQRAQQRVRQQRQQM